MNPNNSEAHYNLGNLYESKSMFEDAKRCFNKAIDINPSDS